MKGPIMQTNAHGCVQEPRLAVIEERVRELREDQIEHHKTLYGNGHPGAKTKVDHMWEDYCTRKKLVQAVIIGVATNIVLNIIGLSGAVWAFIKLMGAAK